MRVRRDFPVGHKPGAGRKTPVPDFANEVLLVREVFGRSASGHGLF